MIGWVCRVCLAVPILGCALLLVGWPATATAGPAFTPGTWTTSGSLNQPRVFPGAARLAGGGVLIAGGSDAEGHSLASAEIYDSATGTWAFTASMHIPRAHPSANLLANDE